jgi:hypothetical protein
MKIFAVFLWRMKSKVQAQKAVRAIYSPNTAPVLDSDCHSEQLLREICFLDAMRNEQQIPRKSGSE